MARGTTGQETEHAPAQPTPLPRLPWRRILVAAALGTALAALLLAGYLRANPLWTLVSPGQEGPAAAVVGADFPGAALEPGLGHDGQQFYVIARDPWHADRTSAGLDKPRYRLQRIAYPALAWALHPGGGGDGLVIALLVVGLLAVFGGAVATGGLAAHVGGRAELAAAFPLLPVSIVSLKLSLADAPALALVTGALLLAARRRTAGALALAVLAVLAKESIVLVLVGWALWRRDRAAVALAVVPAAAGGLWAVWLRLTVPDASPALTEITPPFVGWWRSWEVGWSQGANRAAPLILLGVMALGVALLVTRGLGNPFGWIVAVQLAFVTVLSEHVVGLEFNTVRATAPLLLFAILGFAVPAPARARERTGTRGVSPPLADRA